MHWLNHALQPWVDMHGLKVEGAMVIHEPRYFEVAELRTMHVLG